MSRTKDSGSADSRLPAANISPLSGNRPNKQKNQSADDRRRRHRGRTLQIELLETRTYLDGTGFTTYIDPIWFQTVSTSPGVGLGLRDGVERHGFFDDGHLDDGYERL